MEIRSENSIIRFIETTMSAELNNIIKYLDIIEVVTANNKHYKLNIKKI